MFPIFLAVMMQAGSGPPIVRPPTHQIGDSQACSMFRKIAADAMAEMPIMVDAVTRVDGVSVICSLRTITWNKFLTVNLSQFREGWQERKQSQFNDLVCKNEVFLPMARRGWRFTQNFTFQSGERFIMDADCKGL